MQKMQTGSTGLKSVTALLRHGALNLHHTLHNTAWLTELKSISLHPWNEKKRGNHDFKKKTSLPKQMCYKICWQIHAKKLQNMLIMAAVLKSSLYFSKLRHDLLQGSSAVIRNHYTKDYNFDFLLELRSNTYYSLHLIQFKYIYILTS